jgi:putative ABC transport system permease protein
LILKNIVKNYVIGDITVEALKGIDLEFRKSEFVSVLGPSGCGKTTLLNIVGGLDRYTSGDLAVNTVSTKRFKDDDWDAYRNRSIGFVFQTYNLIPHQTVLANVELAMTLSGVSKSERRKRAVEALEKVGLGDQLRKKPNQISGGQMQRVSIARALVNNPEILLADEPTGALDTETSAQIMEILKEIAQDRLVIMVTHNSDLADRYSTRIIKLLDGSVISDSDPFTATVLDKEEEKQEARSKSRRKKKPPMSYLTALALSLNNLLTKKARTFLTAFAGSIGIIGIASILSLSSGVQDYISSVEQDTMASYPIVIEQQSININSMIQQGQRGARYREEREEDMIYSRDLMNSMMRTMMTQMQRNDLRSFMAFLESGETDIKDITITNDIRYSYATTLNVFRTNTDDGIWQVNPGQVIAEVMGDGANMAAMGGMGGFGMAAMIDGDVWFEMLDNQELIALQYDVVAGRFAERYNEVVVVVDGRNEVTDFFLYTLGMRDISDLPDLMDLLTLDGGDMEISHTSHTFDEFLDLTFRLVPTTSFFDKVGEVWIDRREDPLFMRQVIENAIEIKVVGIIKPSENAAIMGAAAGAIGYRSDLVTTLVEVIGQSTVVREQQQNPETNVFTGRPFGEPAPFDITQVPPEYHAMLATMSEEEIAALMVQSGPGNRDTLDAVWRTLGYVEWDNPSRIQLFPRDFAGKDRVIEIIDEYNEQMRAEGLEERVIHYVDFVGLIMASVSSIINTISSVLISFVAISLIVSSIMIGVITYISVLERTKEIGILRSIGASKNDISRVFNAETLIVGFVAGSLGIVITLILIIPANIIIYNITDVSNLAGLPLIGGVALILVSMGLTFIAGLIPSRIAANKDPVVALRTE